MAVPVWRAGDMAPDHGIAQQKWFYWSNKEAAVGPIGLLQDGDQITIAEAGTIDVDLSGDELAKRKAAWTPRGTDYNAGAI